MKYEFFMGIDVSKNSLSISIQSQSVLIESTEIENTPKALRALITRLKKKGITPENILICLEYTGVYTYHLLNEFYAKSFPIWIEHAQHIKGSMRMARGKNDKVDALRIAEYAYRYHDKCILWKPQRGCVAKLKKLFSIRTSLMKTKQRLGLSITQSKNFESKESTQLGKNYLQPILKKIELQIEKVNQEMREIIAQDARLKELQVILTSIVGIGEVVAWKLITVTNEFISFNDARKFACYSGVVPFEHQSGTSVRGKSRVSFMANKEMKTLLHLAALAAVSRKKGELYDYFVRKVEEGKNKMSVINAVRNKIIQRVFSCVRKNQKYDYSYANEFA